MKASEFPDLLRNLEIPGVSVRPANGKPGSGLRGGFIVEGRNGARIAWQVVIQEYGQAASSEPFIAYPDPVPVKSDRMAVADIEASIAAWIGASAAEPYVQNVRRYSETNKSGITYGLALDLVDGGRVFIQALWILRPGEEPDSENKYRMLDTV